MKKLNKAIGRLGGIVSIYTIPSESILKIEGGKLFFKSTDNIIEIECTAESIEFSEPQKRSRAGIFFCPKITAFAPGTVHDDKLIAEIGNKRLCVLLFDNNDQYILFGNLKQRLRCLTKKISGKKMKSKNGCEFVFTGTTMTSSQKVIPIF